MSLAYSRYHGELTDLLKDVARIIDATAPPERGELRSRLERAAIGVSGDGPLRVAFIGEFNAGKSSLIRALTGAEVAIDADVCTATTSEFEWRGLTVIDTPGVQAEDEESDHDRIARVATATADLVLFVVTNELFNPRLAQHLRFLLDDSGLGLARKTALIVNKIDRESNPDEVLLGEVQRVLGPHQSVSVYFCAASKWLRALESPPELQARFLEQSRLSALISGLDRFVDEAGTLGRLATPLQVVAELTDALQGQLVTSNEDRKHIEMIRRQKAVLERLQKRLRDIRKTWKQQAYSLVIGRGNAAVEHVDELTEASDLERLFELGMKEAVADIEQLYDGLEGDLSDALADARRELDDIGESPLAHDVGRLAADRAGKVGVDSAVSRPHDTALLGRLGKAAAKPLEEGLKGLAKNAKGIKDAVYEAGKAIGYKFRPWEAVKAGEKLAKIAGRAGKAVPFLAAALDLYFQYREEKVKEERARYLAGLRVSLRNAFAEQAKLEANALEDAVVNISDGPVSAALRELDASARDIIQSGARRDGLATEVGAIRARCTELRTQLINGVSGSDARS